ncbi:SusC/RagA family TonB-linked outer membrane protein [Proteiniphilum propionicum]|uniref:SusC/RagA family TonB-linked outer membrane protein n=2 Tax=Proteiniphilum TaxID=294702 RepID=UPI001EEB9F95|nr:SusC/RagA family TonB-linked outer membrane protein [Proteiniphilum propionicum]
MYTISFTKKYCPLFVCVICCFCMGLGPIKMMAQDKGNAMYTCRILDQANNPVSGVVIRAKGENAFSQTNSEGFFSCEYEKGKIITLTHPDYLYKEITLNVSQENSGENLIYLTENALQNNQPVTGPYGESKPKDAFLGASSTVYTDDLTKTVSSTILEALQGRLTGLYISQYRGTRLTESDNSQFFLNSRGNSPIVVIDGVQRDLLSIDPEAIESVSIQKDALSSMFLGMRSSRGALIITTKNPSKGAFHLSLTGQFGVQSMINKPKPLSASQYAYMLNEALSNDHKEIFYNYDDYAKYLDQSSPFTHPDVNWQNELLNDHATTQSYNLNVSGGERVAQYYISLGYHNENGLFKTDPANSYNTNFQFERYMISSKVNINVTEDFTASLTALARLQENNQPGGTGTGYSDLLNAIYTTPNNAYPVKNPNDSWGGNLTFNNNLKAQTLHSGYIADNSRDILGTMNLKYDFHKVVKGLSARFIGSVSTQNRSSVTRTKRAPVYQLKLEEGSVEPSYTMYGSSSPQSNNFFAKSNYQYMYGQFAMDYTRRFDKHNFQATLLGDTRTELVNNELPKIPSNVMETLSYDYDDKYFVQLALTESYYNRYAEGRRWGTFHAVGLGWDISKENFMSSFNKNINQFKLRGVYGKTGNGIDNTGYYDWRQTFEQITTAAYPQGSSMSNGYFTREYGALANPFITWEKSQKVNLGLDASFFNRRLQLTVDYYNDKYYDLLQTRGKNIELMGISFPTENIGKVRRFGTDVWLTYQDHVGSLNYYLSANWSTEQSRLLFKDEQNVPYDYLRETGRPAGALFGLVADGFLTAGDLKNGYPVMEGYENIQPGDVKYVDMNKDGTIDEFDRTVIGGDKPFSYFGANLGFEWRGVEFSMLWQGAYNRDIYLSDRTLTEGFQSIGQSYGQAYQVLLNRWTPENAATATLPRLSAGGNGYNHQYSSLWMKSGNFYRLKNIHLAYSLPVSVSQRLLGGVRVKLFVSGQNLFTKSAQNWVDPEVSFTSAPLQRCVSTGINFKF